jgi:hypothetical protein
MKLIINRKLDMFERVARFGTDYPLTPANPRATALYTALNGVIADLGASLLRQLNGGDARKGGVNVRKELQRALRGKLREINRTARQLDRETHPGLAEQFRLPKSGACAALIAFAESVVLVATPIKAAFVELEMPADFLDELEDLTEAFATATGQRDSGLLTQVGGTASLFLRAADGLKAASELDAIVRNHFRAAPATLAIWSAARKVAWPKRENVPATTPPAGGDSGGGTGAGSGTGSGS